ncbi:MULTISPECIES: glycoside hydrolase family 3 N-terminal domain-containing protein [unclassified Paenibacillus]|uniref:glycoside hydrolase family 3 N-terminal domain-containing protein n=1 Tax=unclassified Paenibacillus TaxID=185978 RepID=UPI002405009A|nr:MULTISPECIES: glycoside hydrolase family 3 N-terminal domain-containing protein [unclassified Paenibacillus]MDF9843167.1 beta-glucosidase [Paenibacillus sp. PastF-2]MDF9849621.1 beta-glucosidase [Paenibacillus sp. PastM-2]MDF9856462.1 beta-glucosidase [Paenibacillus sp. PastF-1]MDH6481733.1 beta-glucosidase [Paenibacillus sp. PastH-2]
MVPDHNLRRRTITMNEHARAGGASGAADETAAAVEKLLSEMTLEEKIGQMTQSAGTNTDAIGSSIQADPLAEQIRQGRIGSVINLGMSAEETRELQQLAVQKSRLGIPLLFCQDVIHGFQTIFPIPLAWSCSFDPELIREAVRASAREASAVGTMLAFSPMLDIARDPRWGRVAEGSGEDPYLASLIAKAQVKGYQGERLGEEGRMAACLKHFIGYGAAEGGRDYNTVSIDDVTLRNVYLPPFKAGVEAGAASVMAAFNVVNGVPAAGNRALLKGLLREELDFKGVVVSDYAAVEEMIAHGAAEDGRDAAVRTAGATLDIEMATPYFNRYLPEAVRAGDLDGGLIDEAVRRILTLKFRMGIMDDPYRFFRPAEAERVTFSGEHLELARKVARKSAVLLKNSGILPLGKGKRVALLGPLGDSKDMLGTWQFSRYGERTVTIREGLEQAGYALMVEAGCGIREELPGGIERAVAAAREADVVLLALGEDSSMSGEASSRQNITVPEIQARLAEAVRRTGKPVVLLLSSGRPLLLDWFDRNMDAILETWFLGSQAGHAIADVLSGAYNPSGKLTMSFPRHTGQIPFYYNRLNTGRPVVEGVDNPFTSRYLDGSNDPLYPFGYGLSYTEFAITDLQMDGHHLTADKPLRVSVSVANAGSCAGEETVQLYIRDVAASIARPVKELKDFRKVFLQPGESAIVTFEITEDKLRFYNAEGSFVSEKGRFILYIGKDATDRNLMSAEFYLK